MGLDDSVAAVLASGMSENKPLQIAVVGGGAAGFFGAIAAAELGASVTLFEKGSQFLTKVRISGGGRCNVTHACFEPRALAERYPRGKRALIGPFNRFQPRDTVEWFQARGVPLKTESDGRIFPVSDSSQSIIDCLLTAAEKAGVILRPSCGVAGIRLGSRVETEETPAQYRNDLLAKTEGFELRLATGETFSCDRVLLAGGGCRTPAAGTLATSFGHTLVPPVPSLFTFEIRENWLREIPGVVADVKASVPGTKLHESGPLLITHWGVSGPAILRLSAWGARELHDKDYHFPLHVDWLPGLNAREEITKRRIELPGRAVWKSPIPPLAARLWEKLVQISEIDTATTWNRLPRDQAAALVEALHRTELRVTGKSLNKDEFVTCGGVRLPEVDFRTMESRLCPRLFFAGEILDIDGITGGFNFQAAWTTAWIAGNAMART
ncbi:MAG TPA: NAD(P)/FAD-dependent oxidoreductase [Chthoniobacterales bacterium]